MSAMAAKGGPGAREKKIPRTKAITGCRGSGCVQGSTTRRAQTERLASHVRQMAITDQPG